MRPGQLLTLGGALVVLLSLWMPWYELDVGAMRSAFEAGAGELPPGWAQFFDGLAAALPASLTANGWVALDWADIALVAVVAAVGALTLLGPRTATVVAATRGAASLAMLVVIIQIVGGPDPNELFSLRAGPWVALAGAGAMLAGGWWRGGASDGWPTAAAAPPAPPAWTPPAGPSVPPPR